MRLLSTQKKGFTLIELMVVIAIIAILAIGGIAQYNRYIQRGEVSRVLKEFAVIEDAFYEYLILDLDLHHWPNESEGASGTIVPEFVCAKSDPASYTLQDLFDCTGGFGGRMDRVFENKWDWYGYDNDGDTMDCDTGTPNQGANLFIRNVPQTYREILNDMVDDDESLSSCNRVREYGSGVIWNLQYRMRETSQ